MSTCTGPVLESAPPSSVSVMSQLDGPVNTNSLLPPVGPKVMSSS